MVGFILLAGFICLVAGAPAEQPEPPKVEFEDCSKLELTGFDECMRVTFKMDPSDEMVLVGLNYRNNNKTSMSGRILSKPGSRVSVTLHENVAYIMISTKDHLYKFTLDKASGSSAYDTIQGRKGVTYHPPLEAPGSSVTKDMQKNVESRRLPAQGFLLKVYVLYDQAFSSRFGSEAEERIDEVFNHVETFFSHSSLGTSITPVEVGKSNVQDTFPADPEDLVRLKSYVQRTSELPDADAYVLLSSQNERFGTVGIAWRGSTCHPYRGVRTSIAEYRHDDITTAETVVHEIGHNLGMRHDFHQSWDGTSDKFAADKRTPCTGVGGYMDYEMHSKNAEKWSRCSVEDFDKYYQNNKPFCLQLKK